MHREEAARKNAAAHSAMWADDELPLLQEPGRRKGKGGRQPAADPRLDPNIDPKRAKRILANRQSAARSKMKQKSHVEALRKKVNVLTFHRHEVAGEIVKLKNACKHYISHNVHMTSKLEELSAHHNSLVQTHAQLVEVRRQLARDSGLQPPPQAPSHEEDLLFDLAHLAPPLGDFPESPTLQAAMSQQLAGTGRGPEEDEEEGGHRRRGRNLAHDLHTAQTYPLPSPKGVHGGHAIDRHFLQH